MTIVLVATLLSASALGQDAKVDPVRVEAAIDKGIGFLRTAKTPGSHHKIEDTYELVLLTLVHAGMRENDEQFQKLFKKLLEEPLEKTYKVALQAMILEEVDRVKYQPRIAQCAQFLVDNQCLTGQWSYGEPTAALKDLPPITDVATPAKPRGAVRDFGSAGVKGKPKVTRKLQVTKTKDGPATGDNSNSQYAALGLRACHDSGIVFPKGVLQLARKWWIASQHPAPPGEDKGVATGGEPEAKPRGWCYSLPGVCAKSHQPYASMTTGAIGALAICNYILELDTKKDPAIRSGVAWLNSRWSVKTNEGPSEVGGGAPAANLYYYLYALERMGMLLDVPTVGKHDWYFEGATVILDAQKRDGSWIGDEKRGNETWDTCFAILFLKKATERLVASEDRKINR